MPLPSKAELIKKRLEGEAKPKLQMDIRLQPVDGPEAPKPLERDLLRGKPDHFWDQ